jgi:hypothetical protein
MKKVIFVFGILLTFFACTNNQENEVKEEVTIEGLKSSIKEMDDSLMVLMEEAVKSPEYKMNRVAYHEAINRNKEFYTQFPNDAYAEVALDKIAALYLQLNVESESVKWRDTLLNKYPNTKNKIGLLELQMNYYDFNENNPEKIKYYANQLLAIDNLSEERREQYEFRLKHIDKTFEELIELQIEADTLEIEAEAPQ